jgi:hypothetical protein
VRQCERGHFYDETRYPTCRYCEDAASGAAAGTLGATVALGQPGATGPALGKTVPLRSAGAGVSPPADPGRTVAVIRGKIGIDPAVAFAVAVEGPHRGEDFRLKAGRAFIGRATESDIALTSDDAVSREAHALISYDSKGNEFLIAPGQSRGLTYRNGHQVANAEPLEAYDTIEVGATKLIFLPLCGPQFRWA